MTEIECEDWMHLLYRHHNYIYIFDKNPKYSYKPFGIFRKNNTFVLKFDVVETNKIEYESREDYEIDPIFNQEPRVS